VLLKECTAAALLLPKGELPEAGTVVKHDGAYTRVVTESSDSTYFYVCADGFAYEEGSANHNNWRYATPAEIDASAEASALPDIVDPLDAMVDEVLETWPKRDLDLDTCFRSIARAAILAERARKAVG
jgi:hypothetical protein